MITLPFNLLSVKLVPKYLDSDIIVIRNYRTQIKMTRESKANQVDPDQLIWYPMSLKTCREEQSGVVIGNHLRGSVLEHLIEGRKFNSR